MLAACVLHLLAKIAKVWSIPADVNHGSTSRMPHNGIPLYIFPKARKLHITSYKHLMSTIEKRVKKLIILPSEQSLEYCAVNKAFRAMQQTKRAKIKY